MLQKIKTLFKGNKADTKNNKDDISLAVTAVMVQVMNIDGKMDAAERHVIFQALEKRFKLSGDAVDTLIKKAKQANETASDSHQFTKQIINYYNTQERIQFLTELWQVAMIDGHIDPYEEQLIRRIAKLIGVYHGEFIQAKIDARNHVNEA